MAPPRNTVPLGGVPRAKRTPGGLTKPETRAEAKRLWEEEGISFYEVETRLGLPHRGHCRSIAEREEWERKPGVTDPKDYEKEWKPGTRAPDPFKWMREVNLRILDKTEGGGWVPFRAWDFQKEVMKARIKRTSGIAVKSRQLGMTTCLQVADLYSLIWGGPFHCHWVAKDLEKSKEMLREIRESIVRCKFPEGIAERLDIGGTSSNVIRFTTDRYSNYIHCHAPTDAVARGFPGNTLLLDEAAFMPYAESIYTGFMGMMSDVEGGVWIVSTPNPEDVWFQTMYKNASAFGLTKWRVDWRNRPGRDERWHDAQLKRFGGREDLFDQEHECAFVQPQKLAFNVEAMKVRAEAVSWVGDQTPVPGHIYVTGGDQSMSGAASTIACSADVSVMPAQVVGLDEFNYDPAREVMGPDGKPWPRTLQKAAFFDEWVKRHPGPACIDGTNEQATIEMMAWPQKIMVRFRGDTQPKKDLVDGMVTLYWPRAKLIENAVKLVDSGRLVVHPDAFPQLYEAFNTALRYHMPDVANVKRPGQQQKRQGKRNDELDAFLLMCLALTDLLGPTQNGMGGVTQGAVVTGKRRSGSHLGTWKPRRTY